MARVVSVLCNPESGRVRGRIPDVRRIGTVLSGGRYLEVDGAGLAGGKMRDFVAGACDLLVVVGGDGTLHAVLGALLGPGRSVPVPAVLVVPAGTTNMSAIDLGVQGTPLQVLLRLQQDLERGQVPRGRRRPVLGVEGQGMPRLCGMFFGAGLISRGVQYFSEHVRGSGVTGEAASGVVVARFLGALLGADGAGLARPVDAEFEGVAGLEGRRSCSVVLATVLDRLLLGMRPYWGRGPGPIHLTAVRHRPERLWRRLWPLIRGRGTHLLPEHGYFSANVEAAGLRLDGPFIVDGQCYETPRDGVRLNVAGEIEFLCP